MAKKKIIHVNQHVIRSNKKTGSKEPVITVKSHNSNEYGHVVVIYDKEGKEAARVIYRPEKPLSCGATVWLEVHGDNASVEVINHNCVEELSCGGIDNVCQQNKTTKTADDEEN